MSRARSYENRQQTITWPPQDERYYLIKHIIVAILGVLVLAISSQISVPKQPVPLTFQSATVILIGMSCGMRLGSLIVIAYLILGTLGLPIFADLHGGISELISPRGGYLIGFIPAVMLSGYLAARGFARNILASFVSACLCDGIIFLCGILWLASFTGFHQAWALGFTPFIDSEFTKLLTLACVVPMLWK